MPIAYDIVCVGKEMNDSMLNQCENPESGSSLGFHSFMRYLSTYAKCQKDFPKVLKILDHSTMISH